MATKRPKRPTRSTPRAPEQRGHVTRLEYLSLLDLAQKTQEAVRRLEQEAAVQFRRTVEQQTEINALKKALPKS